MIQFTLTSYHSYKLALGLPPTTSTEKLLSLGIYNTWEELAEAHKTSQIERLKLTSTGRDTLIRLGYRVEYEYRKRRVPLPLREKITVANIPRNMHPEYNRERRQAKVQVLCKAYEGPKQEVRYTDATKYNNRAAHAIGVINCQGQEVAVASVNTPDIDCAEETAIALVATTGKQEESHHSHHGLANSM